MIFKIISLQCTHNVTTPRYHLRPSNFLTRQLHLSSALARSFINPWESSIKCLSKTQLLRSLAQHMNLLPLRKIIKLVSSQALPLSSIVVMNINIILSCGIWHSPLLDQSMSLFNQSPSLQVKLNPLVILIPEFSGQRLGRVVRLLFHEHALSLFWTCILWFLFFFKYFFGEIF